MIRVPTVEGHFLMKRFLASALIVGVASFGMAGCGGEEAKKVETVKTEGGTTTSTTDTKSTGANPPPNSAGETGATANPNK